MKLTEKDVVNNNLLRERELPVTDKRALGQFALSVLDTDLQTLSNDFPNMQLLLPEGRNARDMFYDFYVPRSKSVPARQMLRQRILERDLIDVKHSPRYFPKDTFGRENDPNLTNVSGGQLNNPYDGNIYHLQDVYSVARMLDIDHVVSLSNAWQTGAAPDPNDLRKGESLRHDIAVDPDNLLAVDRYSNSIKSDKDISLWQPSNTEFLIQFAAIQILIKRRYRLRVTKSERHAFRQVITNEQSYQVNRYSSAGQHSIYPKRPTDLPHEYIVNAKGDHGKLYAIDLRDISMEDPHSQVNSPSRSTETLYINKRHRELKHKGQRKSTYNI